MSQYLNCELVNRKTKEVVALFSLPNTFRDMAREDEFDCYHDNLVPDAKNYDGDSYQGKTTVSKLKEAIAAKRQKIDAELKKRTRLENLMASAKTDLAYRNAEDEIRSIDDYIEFLNEEIDSIQMVITFVLYECDYRDIRKTEDEIDDNTGQPTGKKVLGYPLSRSIPLDDVELNLWLNF